MADRRRIEAAATRPNEGDVSHRWRFLPVVDEEIDELRDEDAVSVDAQMKIVQKDGLRKRPDLVAD